MKKKSANCIIFNIFNNILHSDFPSRIIHLPSKIPYSETSYVTLKNIPQRQCKQEEDFQKAVPINVHEKYFLSQCKWKHELNKDFLTQLQTW